MPTNISSLKYLKLTFWVLAIVLGFIQAWAHQYNFYFDVVAHLDIGDAYMRGDWKTAINTSYSPLYSFLLGFTLFILKPSPYWEYTCVLLVNFLIYLFALLCYEFFLQKIILYNKRTSLKISKRDYVGFSERATLVLGYSFFIFYSLIMIDVSTPAPDMLVSAFVYLIVGILLQIRVGTNNTFIFIFLGFMLGLGYLVKEVMFPLAFVFLGTGFFAINNLKERAKYLLVTLAAFLVISTPFIALLSKSKGYFTFGNAWKLNYLCDVNEVSGDWLDKVCIKGKLYKPTKMIFSNPNIYEYCTPFDMVTYPPAYDRSYWFEGAKINFSLKNQLKALVINFKEYLCIIIPSQGEIIFVSLLLFCFAERKRFIFKCVLNYWIMLIPALTAIIMYLLVHIEKRYIAPFVLLLWFGLFLSTYLSKESKKLLSSVTIALSLVLMFRVCALTGNNISAIANNIMQGKSAHVMWMVASKLNQMGLQAGDKVATIADSYDQYWARLAKVTIIAQMLEEEDLNSFWAANNTIKSAAINALAKTGAKAIITQDIPAYAIDYALKTGWKKLGETDHYAYFFSMTNPVN